MTTLAARLRSGIVWSIFVFVVKERKSGQIFKPGLPILCHISWLTCLSREPPGAFYPPGLLPGSRDTPAGEALTFPHTFAWFCVLSGPFQPNPASVPRPPLVRTHVTYVPSFILAGMPTRWL